MRITSVHNMYPRLTCPSQVFSSLHFIEFLLPMIEAVSLENHNFLKNNLTSFTYNTRAIITRSWFETALDYKISVHTKLPSKHQINMGGSRIPQEVSTLNGELKFIPETLLFMSVIFHFSLLNLTFWHFTLVYLRFWMSTALVKINTNHFWPLKMSRIRFMTFKTRFNWI